jgi:hypothetical protein
MCDVSNLAQDELFVVDVRKRLDKLGTSAHSSKPQQMAMGAISKRNAHAMRVLRTDMFLALEEAGERGSKRNAEFVSTQDGRTMPGVVSMYISS